MSDISTIVSPERNPRLRWLAGLLILVITAIRFVYLFFLCPYDLAPDEGHYWDWSRHLDWSYYSKGPLIAWIIRAGCEVFGDVALSVNGTLMPAVRAPAILCGAGLLAAFYVLTWQTYHSDKMAFTLTVVAMITPAVALCSMIMTIDAPFLCCWCWALVFGRWAMIDGRRWAWPIAGLFIALGILAKYTMALWLMSAGLFLLFTPTHRRILWQSGFWIMVAVSALSALPILYWNSQNDWVTFRHVAVQAGVTETKRSTGIRWLGPFEYLGSQLMVMLGVWFVIWVAAMIRFRPSATTPIGLRLLWWMSAPTFIVFLASSLRASGQPNWPVAAYLSGAVLSIAWLAQVRQSNRPRLQRATYWSIGIVLVLGVLLTILAHNTRIVTTPISRIVPEEDPSEYGTPFRIYDPAARLKGARYLSAKLDAISDRIVETGGPAPILAGMRWDRPGLFGFYGKGHPQAYSFGLALRSDRHSQYDHWRPNPTLDAQDFLGSTFIIVGAGDPRKQLVEMDAFESFDEPFEIVYREHGRAMARWSVFICRGFKGFKLEQPLGHGVGH